MSAHTPAPWRVEPTGKRLALILMLVAAAQPKPEPKP
jgi:hypothetical protein